ncbi:uncharacterized protein LOC135167684 isoform X1 [Diachasmimorpha longicaudata]|uniref:uncharacterized protein LOC135167684 isoform X1 n=1 Tax=Diachasmimorpha longicaudata TaxID=58733 RepID=UPI0030B8E86B
MCYPEKVTGFLPHDSRLRQRELVGLIHSFTHRRISPTCILYKIPRTRRMTPSTTVALVPPGAMSDSRLYSGRTRAVVHISDSPLRNAGLCLQLGRTRRFSTGQGTALEDRTGITHALSGPATSSGRTRPLSVHARRSIQEKRKDVPPGSSPLEPIFPEIPDLCLYIFDGLDRATVVINARVRGVYVYCTYSNRNAFLGLVARCSFPQ